MADINSATPLNFENDGVITLGASTVAQYEPGSLRITPGLKKTYPYRDRGARKTPLTLGDEQTTIEFEIKLTDLDTTTEVYQVLAATNAGASGLVAPVALKFKWPDYREAITGVELDCGTVYLPEGGMNIQTAGEDGIDTIPIRVISDTPNPTAAAY